MSKVACIGGASAFQAAAWLFLDRSERKWIEHALQGSRMASATLRSLRCRNLQAFQLLVGRIDLVFARVVDSEPDRDVEQFTLHHHVDQTA